MSTGNNNNSDDDDNNNTLILIIIFIIRGTRNAYALAEVLRSSKKQTYQHSESFRIRNSRRHPSNDTALFV